MFNPVQILTGRFLLEIFKFNKIFNVNAVVVPNVQLRKNRSVIFSMQDVTYRKR